MLEKVKLAHVQAGAIAAVGIGGMALFAPASALFTAGLLLSGCSALAVLPALPKSNAAKIREVFEAMRYHNKDDKYPVRLNKSDRHHVYELPPGRCPE